MKARYTVSTPYVSSLLVLSLVSRDPHLRHNFIDKKTPKPQPDTTLTDHSVRTELPKSAGQWGLPSPAEPGTTAERVPCKKETGTVERGRGSPSTRTPPMSGSGTDKPRDKTGSHRKTNLLRVPPNGALIAAQILNTPSL